MKSRSVIHILCTLSLMLSLLLGCAGGGTGGTDGGVPVRIAGQVRAPDTTPLGSITVTDLSGGEETLTDDSGRFELPALITGEEAHLLFGNATESAELRIRSIPPGTKTLDIVVEVDFNNSQVIAVSIDIDRLPPTPTPHSTATPGGRPTARPTPPAAATPIASPTETPAPDGTTIEAVFFFLTADRQTETAPGAQVVLEADGVSRTLRTDSQGRLDFSFSNAPQSITITMSYRDRRGRLQLRNLPPYPVLLQMSITFFEERVAQTSGSLGGTQGGAYTTSGQIGFRGSIRPK